MMHTKEMVRLLRPQGEAREFFRKASPGAESWVDQFCDTIAERLSIQEKFERLPPSNDNLWMQVGNGRDTTKWQVNVDVGKTGGWSVETGDDMLAHLVKILNLKHR